jgi:hypothetical protein
MKTCFVQLVIIMMVWLHLPILADQGYIDAPFEQEVHVPFSIAEGEANDVKTICVDSHGNVWAGTHSGVFLLKNGEQQWTALTPEAELGPMYDIISDSHDDIWIGAWNGVYRASGAELVKIEGISEPVAALCDAESMTAFGPTGMWQFDSNWNKLSLKSSRAIRSALPAGNGGFWLATGMGLYRVIEDQWRLFQSTDELLTPALEDIAFAQNGDLWAAGFGGVSILRNQLLIKTIAPKDGLPSSLVQCVERAPNGVMWVGTKQGIARILDGQSSVRHSRRWLLDDDVRDIAFDAEGTAWIATAKGVSAIKRKSVTLAQKDAYFRSVCLARHQREPGIVERCLLETPGDTTSWKPRDDDNDGQYTAMYLAMESYRFAATKSEHARTDAKKAFDALKYLQTVTETDGFVARTVIPISWKNMSDANRTYTDREFGDIRVDNPREKIVEKRWRPSSDGKWLWKGDTSSDEITGHMYGYLFYHDLAADKKEKKVVADLICNVVDYIIQGGYVLRDIDGNPTKWAIWAPRFLNDDPDWRQERGINSIEILSYLKLAFHVSGDKKYQSEYEKLLYEHNYLDNVRRAKTTNPAWRTHIDDELLALAYPALLLYEEDPVLRAVYLESFEQWYAEVGKDCSPYFNFMYAAFTGVDPKFECSIDFLKQTPLDLISWQIDNSRREDVPLVRAPEMEYWQTAHWLPIDEISFFRWDDNPRIANRGHGGRLESDGVFWMLPYWMGRYYGWIE